MTGFQEMGKHMVMYYVDIIMCLGVRVFFSSGRSESLPTFISNFQEMSEAVTRHGIGGNRLQTCDHFHGMLTAGVMVLGSRRRASLGMGIYLRESRMQRTVMSVGLGMGGNVRGR